MKNFITQFSRIFVGLLFIISGLIKLNDPVGFGYKLEEYFSEPVLNLPFLTPLALALAVFLVIFEVVLGIMLLLGYKPKFTVWSLLLMIVFFTFLTFYSAYFNKVTDCGCFGDALKLTPWQSFTKDVVLLFFVLILFINQKLIRPFLPKGLTNGLVYLSVVLCGFMAYWVLNHLPLKDFRAYKVGNNIQKGMEFPEGAERAKIEMIFVYEVNGVKKQFGEKDLMNLPANAKFVERIDNVISQGYVPPIHDFTMEKDGSDYKDELLLEPKLLMFVAYDLKKSSDEGMAELEKIAQQAKSKGYKVIMMTAGLEDEIANAKKKYGHTFDYYFCDATTLKTIERANPSLIVLHKGTIAQKLHWKDAGKLILD
ncbi:DoxX family protein [Flavobacterium sp. MAH-1]|uniref:DoxX family protein n=1 Tax=Flavobacterium agri TaxID=2743471 RepID=A0A7Y8Y4G3_9FLAO|nr:BT_3928 family protein [Flavobacterium agri]NUY82237.1 DoxX family protein [Flavobacterium agri]NYA72261.1 DoxX family protein [Flavobacterium agri]